MVDSDSDEASRSPLAHAADEVDGPPAPARSGHWKEGRPALVVFSVGWLAAFPILLHAGRKQWFAIDEWAFLATRDLSHPSTLFAPHNEHWVTVPIVLYRLTFAVFGLNHYWPYLLLAISAHLAAAVLLRVIMRRAGVGPWAATAGALLFAYLGAGRENFGWGFQVTFAGSLAFGLAHLVLADLDSAQLTRRDVLAWSFGLLALMSSGIGVFMVAAVGLATLLRRGWPVAAFHVIPLGAIFLLWYVVEQPDSPGARGSVSRLHEHAALFLVDTVSGIAGGRLPAIALVVVVAAGAALGIVDDRSRLRREWAVPAALAALALVLTVVTVFGRRALLVAFDVGTPGRYVHVLGAMFLPAIAASIAVLIGRNRTFAGVAAVLFVGAFAASATSLEPTGDARFFLGDRDAWLARADLVEERPVPGNLVLPADDLLVGEDWGVRVDWLRRARAVGDLPRSDDIPVEVRGRAELSVLLVETERRTAGCEEIGAGPVVLERGQVGQVPIQAAHVSWLDGGEERATRRVASTAGGVAVRSTTGRITVAITGLDGSPTTISRCS